MVNSDFVTYHGQKLKQKYTQKLSKSFVSLQVWKSYFLSTLLICIIPSRKTLEKILCQKTDFKMITHQQCIETQQIIQYTFSEKNSDPSKKGHFYTKLVC